MVRVRGLISCRLGKKYLEEGEPIQAQGSLNNDGMGE
jgi:hypothetical protein